MTLNPWQRANILAAINYLKELGRGKDPKAETLAQGLSEVLEPARRAIRLQREAAQAAAASASAGTERRRNADRRQKDRRQRQVPFEGPDRRRGTDRRAADRRGGY